MTLPHLLSRSHPALAAIVVAATGCGSGAIPGDRVGRGTDTLVVEGAASAENVVDNANTSTNFNTEFRVNVRRGNASVADATVIVDSDGGPITLQYDANANRYVGSQSGYFRIYSLDVSAGADSVSGVRVRGPDIHTVAAPSGNDAVDASGGLTVRWVRSVVADGAHLETSRTGFDVDDTGTYDLPSSALDCDPQAAREEFVRIDRRHRVLPAGATGLSYFDVRIRNEHAFLVLPNSGC